MERKYDSSLDALWNIFFPSENIFSLFAYGELSDTSMLYEEIPLFSFPMVVCLVSLLGMPRISIRGLPIGRCLLPCR